MAIVRVNDVDLSYELLGEARDRCLLFIGGLGMDSQFWLRRYTPALADDKYSMLVFNPRGVPPSGSDSLECTVESFAADCSALIDRLGLRQLAVVGASLGALVAQELALTRGSTISGAFLMATQGRQSAFMKAAMRAEDEIYRSGVYPPRAYMAICDMLQLHTWRELTDDKSSERLLRVSSGTNYRDPARQAHFRAAQQYDDRLSRLKHIQARTMVIAFEQDIIMPASLGREVAEAIPNARYFEIKGAAHDGFYTHLDAILPLLKGFVSELGWFFPKSGAS